MDRRPEAYPTGAKAMAESRSPALDDRSTPNGVRPPAEEERARRNALLIVFLVVFIDLLGFASVLPVLPRFADKFLARLIPTTEFWLTGVVLGLLMSSFSMMQFVFAPLWGKLSDRVGRRPILLVGLAASVVFYTLFGVASDVGAEHVGLALTLLFASRLGAGIAGATIPTAQAVVADTTTPEKRKH